MMRRFDWPWRRGATGPLPRYVQPMRVSGPVRLDPTLQTVGEIIEARLGAHVRDLTEVADQTGQASQSALRTAAIMPRGCVRTRLRPTGPPGRPGDMRVTFYRVHQVQ